MKLISMTDFVLEIGNKTPLILPKGAPDQIYREQREIFSYANFLKQPLELWMFVPCDEEGKPITEVQIEKWNQEEQYQKEKERVLFNMSLDKSVSYEDVIEGYEFVEGLTVEMVTLTPAAIKQIGL